MARRKNSKKRGHPAWTPLDPEDANRLTESTSSPGVVYPLETAALPKSLKRMPGADSYWVSAHTKPFPGPEDVTVGGTMAVVRADGELRKAYTYVFGTSSDGRVCFTGPFKDFPEHHIRRDEPVVFLTILKHHPFKPPDDGG